MTKKCNRGFTLVELLVVIAIIGILASVVLASLNTARAKGTDASITSTINGIRTQAALYLTDNSTYGTNTVDESDCAAVDNMFGDPKILEQVTAADVANGGGSVTCNVAAYGATYAISAELIASGTYYSVDSFGASLAGSTALGTNTACP